MKVKHLVEIKINSKLDTILYYIITHSKKVRNVSSLS